jgi:hypothetical protein
MSYEKRQIRGLRSTHYSPAAFAIFELSALICSSDQCGVQS